MTTPKHYDKPITPWMLEEHMESSGNAFVDSRRSDAMEYVFRIKDDLLEDMKKARHCIDEAIRVLEGKQRISEKDIADAMREEHLRMLEKSAREAFQIES